MLAAARRALPRGAPGRIPDAGAVGRFRPRPAAGRGHHDGRDPGARRRHRADGLRRPLGAAGRRRATARLARDMQRCIPSAPTCLAARVAKLVALRRTAARRAQGRPSSCSTSRPMPATPAPPPISSVFDSLHNTLTRAEARRATRSRCPASVDALRERIIDGNAARFGAHANVACPHPRRRPCAPRALAARDRGAVGPGARPAAERRRARSSCSARSSATSSSACSPPSATRATRCGCCSRRASRRPTPSRAFYRWLREDFGAHAVLHFGTHGALEFMPGKQAGLSGRLLAGPADRRPAEPLPLRRQQPVRGHASPSGARRRR